MSSPPALLSVPEPSAAWGSCISSASQTTWIDPQEIKTPSVTARPKDLENESPEVAEEKEGRATCTQQESTSPQQIATAFPEGIRLYLILASLYASVFLVALDQTIVSPAIPEITNVFKSLEDVGWYGSAYFLTSTALQPFFGRLYAMFSLKTIFISTMVIFEIGSLICAVAQSSPMFIIGRAIAGCGVGGAYLGVLTIIVTSTPQETQSMYTGFLGLGYGLGGLSGPLVGGAFTSSVSWRWCFYINLPVGGIILTAVGFLFSPPVRNTHLTALPFREKMARIDWTGTVLIHGSVIALLLVLQWGGVTKPWDDSVIIGLLVGFVAILSAFVVVQTWMGDLATIPLRLLKNKTIALASIVNFCVGAVYFSVVYFIPIYFQTIKGSTAIISGVETIPLILSTVFCVVFAGVLVAKLGYYNPFMIGGGTIATIGCGLLFTLSTTTRVGEWIGYQILAGVGCGLAFMMPFTAAQTVLAGTGDHELGSAIVIFFQTLGGCFFVSISLAIYQNEFISNLQKIPGANVGEIIAGGVTGFRQFVPPSLIPSVVNASADALDMAFVCAIALGGVWTIASLCLDWKSIQGENILTTTAA